MPPGKRWSCRRCSARKSCSRLVPTPMTPQATIVWYRRGRARLCSACRYSLGDSPTALGRLFAVHQHIAGDIAAVHVQACAQEGNQQAARAAARIQRRLPVLLYLPLIVGDFGSGGIVLGPVAGHQTIVPRLHAVTHCCLPFLLIWPASKVQQRAIWMQIARCRCLYLSSGSSTSHACCLRRWQRIRSCVTLPSTSMTIGRRFASVMIGAIHRGSWH